MTALPWGKDIILGDFFVNVAEGRLDLPFHRDLIAGTCEDHLPGTQSPPLRLCGGGLWLNG